MLFITDRCTAENVPTAQKFGGRQIYEVQTRAADAADLAALADELAACDVVTATEVGGGVVPIDPADRAAREAAAAWPACWPRGQIALCRCSAACPRF